LLMPKMSRLGTASGAEKGTHCSQLRKKKSTLRYSMESSHDRCTGYASYSNSSHLRWT
jgi:hypothetical protein